MVLIPYHRPYSRSAGGLLHLISMALELQTTFFNSSPPIHPLHQAAACQLSHLPWIAPPSSIVASTLLPRLSSSSSASSPEQHHLLYFSTNVLASLVLCGILFAGLLLGMGLSAELYQALPLLRPPMLFVHPPSLSSIYLALTGAQLPGSPG